MFAQTCKIAATLLASGFISQTSDDQNTRSMSLELCILASGSAGNAAILRSPSGVLLIDAGIGPRTLSQRLDGTGVNLADISALCLTHLDSDHFSPGWTNTLCRLEIPVYCHADKVASLALRCPDLLPLIRPFQDERFSPIEGLKCEPIHFAHDRLGSHGFVLDGFSYRIGYATDLGRVPSYFFDRFRDLDCIALESNYDPQMQADSGRPWFLKRRITGGHGHLSNAQAFAAIRKLLDRSRRLPDHIVLLHRSLECNCPDLVQTLFSSDTRIAPRLTLAQQHERSDWLRRTQRPPLVGEQLSLAL
ncbi:MAG: MBL fold metallo-hydrolase [Hyphomicrobiaceae bacterium]|nr:MBL fold metallo-hydrolase [Hyphomicrobiaceae bacterium]